MLETAAGNLLHTEVDALIWLIWSSPPRSQLVLRPLQAVAERVDHRDSLFLR